MSTAIQHILRFCTLCTAAWIAVWLFAACTPSVPSRYIQPDELADILIDYHLARAIAIEEESRNGSHDIAQNAYVDAALRKHGITQAELDSSLVYYYSRADRFEAIYKKVVERLEEQAVTLGASQSELTMFAHYDANGDTANVWFDRTAFILTPIAPYNRFDFSFDTDSTYRSGDSFLMQFNADFMFQSGTKDAHLYIAVAYDRSREHKSDTVIAQHQSVWTSGIRKINIPEQKHCLPKHIKGFFYLGDGRENSGQLRLMLVDNLQLVRFHTELPTAADSIATELPDSLSADSVNSSKISEELTTVRADSSHSNQMTFKQ